MFNLEEQKCKLHFRRNKRVKVPIEFGRKEIFNKVAQFRKFFCFLQLSSDVAVKKILAGERADAKGKSPSSKPRDTESRESKTVDQKSHRDKEVGNSCWLPIITIFLISLSGHVICRK